ncbi:MAG: fibronectin type III domain-containing protein [Melioribacteraceae bacterium]|nr:fibronectin type III domain-containing protein [Melioribacteraceae bacterium]
MKKIIKSILSFLSLISILFISQSCVESLSETQTSSTPSIEITFPKSNDTIMVGKNVVFYTASDGAGGTGLSHFELFINGVYVQKFALTNDGNNPTIYITVDSTMIGKTISYYLIVYNKSGKLKVSKVQQNIYIKDRPPKAPSDLAGTFTNSTTVTLLWKDNSYNEKGFELWRKDISNNGTIDYRRIKTLNENTISTTDIGLSSFTAYYYKVRAFNSSGYSEFSNEVSPMTPGGGPWNLKAEGIGMNTIRLTWTDFVPNELGFIIERLDAFTAQFKQLTIVSPNTTEYLDTQQISAGVTYTYRIAYFTSTARSPYSNEVSAATTTLNVPAPNLNYTLTSPNSIRLTWTYDNTLSQSFETEVEKRIISSGSTFTRIATKAAGVTEHFDNNLSAGTYEYRVRQIISSNTNTYTPYSRTIVVTIQ